MGFFYPPDMPVDLLDWAQISSLAWVPAERPEVMCAAHAAGVRAIMNAGDLTEAIADDRARRLWINTQVELMRKHWFDGINFDYELPAKMGSQLAANYTQLVKATSRAFKRVNPHAEISVDVPWAALGNDGRDYDWKGLAEVADRLFVMSYDQQAQVFGRCVAAANSPLPQVAKGVQQYLDLGIPPGKLILGVAWYGYDYPCQPDGRGVKPSPATDLCVLQPVEYRGAPCSDAAGVQRNFREFMAELRAGRNSTALTWDPLAASPHFNYVDRATGQVHQVWFETPESLALRYRLARDLGLRGVGTWNLGAVEHSGAAGPEARQDTAAMWASARVFTGVAAAVAAV
ncbi:hypothetical protein HYH02_002180 [Chlamydomonas schloesseri]|uniref:GH18 domain-containing protein n=1 Tax=Chlamydomonas schloesseri TaxID=2026947 RepID=A0A835WRK5_9CHLO|nr:hypothetical protein HYH02_002180 [Chlamydomonas schloesseri]|eukprot:KAG2452834.1 hypothetical protein HYH02_002180 [Chlamydomonas schloesseri]